MSIVMSEILSGGLHCCSSKYREAHNSMNDPLTVALAREEFL